MPATTSAPACPSSTSATRITPLSWRSSSGSIRRRSARAGARAAGSDHPQRPRFLEARLLAARWPSASFSARASPPTSNARGRWCGRPGASPRKIPGRSAGAADRPGGEPAEEAEEILSRLERLLPGDPELLVLRARLAEQQGRLGGGRRARPPRWSRPLLAEPLPARRRGGRGGPHRRGAAASREDPRQAPGQSLGPGEARPIWSSSPAISPAPSGSTRLLSREPQRAHYTNLGIARSSSDARGGGGRLSQSPRPRARPTSPCSTWRTRISRSGRTERGASPLPPALRGSRRPATVQLGPGDAMLEAQCLARLGRAPGGRGDRPARAAADTPRTPRPPLPARPGPRAGRGPRLGPGQRPHRPRQGRPAALVFTGAASTRCATIRIPDPAPDVGAVRQTPSGRLHAEDLPRPLAPMADRTWREELGRRPPRAPPMPRGQRTAPSHREPVAWRAAGSEGSARPPGRHEAGDAHGCRRMHVQHHEGPLATSVPCRRRISSSRAQPPARRPDSSTARRSWWSDRRALIRASCRRGRISPRAHSRASAGQRVPLSGCRRYPADSFSGARRRGRGPFGRMAHVSWAASVEAALPEEQSLEGQIATLQRRDGQRS